jgi:serine/threonine-protein kinase
MGIIHRDLKPDNIMIARGRAGEDVAKVVDFGIAKAMQGDDQKVTKTGLAIGTPEYMSPEQLGGDQLDSRTDIYSLGLVTFNMLTGQLPFPSVVSREALIMRLTEKPRTLAEIRNDVQWPPELQTVMDKALANHPADRYQHVSQFGRELVTAVATMPESAFTSTGTVELSPIAAAAKTEARPLGGGAAARRDRSKEELPVPELEEEKAGSPVALIFGVLVLLILGGGGGWWYWNSRQLVPSVAAPATAASVPAGSSTSTLDTATKDTSQANPATLATAHDTTPAATPALPADSSQIKTRAAEPAGNALSSDEINALLAPIREDLSVGRERMNEGEYDGAVVRFGSAQDKIAPLARKYADVAQIRSLKRDIGEALSQNRAACKAERDVAKSHGDTVGGDCP